MPAVDSPKKRTNKFGVFLPWRVKKQKKTNSFVRFLGEPTACQSAYGFIWPLEVEANLLYQNVNELEFELGI